MIMLKEAHCADIFTILLGNLKAVDPDQQNHLWRKGNGSLEIYGYNRLSKRSSIT